MTRIILRTAMCLSAIFLPAQPLPAQSTDYELAQIVVKRKKAMFDLQTAYWDLFNVQAGKSTDFKAAAEAAAGMGATMDLFVSYLEPGSARGDAPGTRARPEIWSEADSLNSAAQAFKDSAKSMSDVASAGDPDEFSAEFEAFTAACTACHGLRPSSGGAFRFAKDE